MVEQDDVSGDKGGCTGTPKGISGNGRNTRRRELVGRLEISKQNAGRDRTKRVYGRVHHQAVERGSEYVFTIHEKPEEPFEMDKRTNKKGLDGKLGHVGYEELMGA